MRLQIFVVVVAADDDDVVLGYWPNIFINTKFNLITIVILLCWFVIVHTTVIFSIIAKYHYLFVMPPTLQLGYQDFLCVIDDLFANHYNR